MIKLVTSGIGIEDIKDKNAIRFKFYGCDNEVIEIIIDDDEMVFLSLDRNVVPKLEDLVIILNKMIERGKEND